MYIYNIYIYIYTTYIIYIPILYIYTYIIYIYACFWACINICFTSNSYWTQLNDIRLSR